MMKYIIPLLIVFTVVFSWNAPVSAQLMHLDPPKDSKELKIQDILILLLGEEIEKAVNNYYSNYLTELPSVYPYQVDIVNVERVEGFHSFHFLLTLELSPVIGPHIAVGKDRLTFEITPLTPGDVKLIKFGHLETYELPPHWKDIVKRNKAP
ncbi:DUF3888 domain-containing protein [Oceanobacillus sp. M65]|uniref:DUF3888 domain-containing protein n=1 Tax=Oceanobacillus sp. M65 TaxID=3457435 RepID=UPI003FCC8D81